MLALAGCFSAPPQIVSLEPNRGSTSVPANAPVRVVFDRPVTRASLVGRFSVSPGIPGCDLATAFSAPSTAPCWIHWLDPEPGFELLHDGAVFAPATPYTFTLTGGFADPQGDRNDLDHHWVLTTAAAPILAASTPADLATNVAVDAPLSVSFSAPMDAPSTAGAISLSPPVAGTRVVRNTDDHSRFVILPGQLLAPNTAYSITVGDDARGEDEQFIGPRPAVRFTTGARVESPHAAVLAGVQGESPTEVLLPGLAPAQAGEPVPAPVLLHADRCSTGTGCGPVAVGAAMQTYAAAVVSPDGAYVAVVVDDAVSVSSFLEVIDTVDGTVVADVPNGERPSWSPDASAVALAAGTDVDLYDVRAQTLSRLAAGTRLAATPLWAGNTTVVLSTAATTSTPGSVELVNRALDAMYQLPAAPAGSIALAVSPGGTRIALSTPAGRVVVVPAPGSPGGTQALAGSLQPLGFAAEGILVAVSTTAENAQLVRISVVGGDTTTVSLSAGIPDVQSVRVSLDGRRLVFLAVDSQGVQQGFVANADGTQELPVTRFLVGGLEAQAVAFAG